MVYNVFDTFDESTDAFTKISTPVSVETITDIMHALERYVVLLYDRTSSATSVDETRKDERDK